MLRIIFRWVLIAIILVFLFVWLIGGGWTRTHQFASNIWTSANPWARDGEFHLPGELTVATPHIIIDEQDISVADNEIYYNQTQKTQISGQTPDKISTNKTSAYSSQIVMRNGGESANGKYVILTNIGSRNVSLSGWSLADDYNHLFRLPQATDMLGNQVPAVLSPGESAIVFYGQSPTGISFRDQNDNTWKLYLNAQGISNLIKVRALDENSRIVDILDTY